MITRPASQGATPQKYVQQLRLGSRASSSTYLCTLNGFQRFLAEQPDGTSVSQETLRQWLNDRIRVWSPHTVTIRARQIDRFLDWMVHRGALAHNPFVDLRRKYGQRTTKPIVRALLNPDFEAALEALRPAPRFGSFLGPMMREYVALMQAMGYCYNTEEKRLLLLDRFLQDRPDLRGQSLPVLIREWTNTGSTPQHTFVCHLTGRVLSRALSRVDPTIEQIPWDKRIFQQAQQRYRQPYIFSDQEFLYLLEAALSFPSPQSPLRPKTLHMMLVLAYCAGLRIGEIVRLNAGDFDRADRTIEIRRTKFFKSRRLPLSNSVAAALQTYLDARKQGGAPTTADAALFWHRQAAGRYSRGMTESLLIRVLQRAGLKRAPGHIGPHVHDLRHRADFSVMPTFRADPAREALSERCHSA
jgi:site-specific recombinase XerD